MKWLFSAAGVLGICLAVLASLWVRCLQLGGNWHHEVQGGFCISGPDYPLYHLTSRAKNCLPDRAALGSGRVEFSLGAAAEQRPRVQIDVAAGKVVLFEIESRTEAGGVESVCYELSCDLPAAEMNALVDGLLTPEFLVWGESAHEYYGADLMDGTLLELIFSTSTGYWKVVCSNHFPEPLRRFGCILTQQVRQRRFGLESSAGFISGTYRPPTGVTVKKSTR